MTKSKYVLLPPDFSAPFCLKTDNSEIDAGTIFFLKGESSEERRIVSYAKKFSDTQKWYLLHSRTPVFGCNLSN